MVPIGYLVSVALMASGPTFALTPVRRPWPVSVISYYFGLVLNELPFLAFFYLLASMLLAIAQDDLATPLGWVAFGLVVLATAGLVIVAVRALPAATTASPAATASRNSGSTRGG